MDNNKYHFSNIDPNIPLYSIGFVEKKIGISASTIRAWENLGLIKPSRTVGGHRRYSRQHINKLLFIQSLTSAGYKISAIPTILKNKKEGSLTQKIRTLNQLSKK